MVVDDDVDIRDLAKMALEKEGFEVEVAGSGFECLEMLENGYRPDVIFLDVMMPNLDGWTVSRKIKINPDFQHIQICILTAKTTTLDALMSVESAHADWHLNKPITQKLLLETAKWMLSN